MWLWRNRNRKASCMRWLWIARRKTLRTFCRDFVQEFGLWYRNEQIITLPTYSSACIYIILYSTIVWHLLRIRIRDPVPFWPLDPESGAFLTPGSGIRNRFFADLGSRIPNPYFWELIDNLLGKKFYNSLKIGPNYFLKHFKKNNFKFCEICGYKKWYDNKFFFSPLFCCCFCVLDPRSRIRDPGWVKIRIRDKHPGSTTLYPIWHII